MQIVACDWCGNDLKRYPSQIHPTNFCNRHCLGKYRTENWTSTRAANWKGGKRTTSGRVEWHMPWHHRASKKGYVFRYIIVAELKLQRPLMPGEVVHHIDGDPTNDHPDNLHVFPCQAEHARLHGLNRPVELMDRMRASKRKAL